MAKRPGGVNLVARRAGAPPYYPAATAPAVRVAVFEHDAGEPVEAARLVGYFAPGAKGSLPFNPATDRNKVLRLISYSQSGAPDVSQLAHATAVTVIFNRETAAPAVQQVGAAASDRLTLGITGFTEYARRRRIRIADNSSMTGASVIEYDSGDQIMPRYVDILRNPPLQAAFTWSGGDPGTNGFTKQGSGPTQASGNAWRINTAGTDAATYYTKNGFPASPFQNGFTLEVQPPAVTSAESDQAVVVRVEDGAKRYELQFTGTQVKLNGGTAHAHGGARVRLVIAQGGATADLWIGTTKSENDTAGQATTTSGLSFGDLATTDDADAGWSYLAYALLPQEPNLTRTIYVRVSHSAGNSYGPESAAQSFTFADEYGGGGTSGTTDELYYLRQQVDLTA
ncbi:MAG TPA: hypothetical protein VNQ79_29215 [Blastocatellia bacterium]|nr:hypothetical protein [Blastocatellia bacterium]